MAKHTFVISDESVLNAHGFRVMTGGINIDQYNKNPIVLWWHKRPIPWNENTDSEVMPIGKASNLRKEGSQLLADIEFDQDDDFARKIEKKIENGFINMCSPGLDPVTISEDEDYLLPGQKYATLVESELVEISIADIGSNPNALKVQLYNSNKELVTLSRDDDRPIIPLVNNQTENSNDKSMEFIKRVATQLALNPDASEKSVLDTLNQRLELANQADSLKTEVDNLKEQLKLANERQITELVDANVDKKFTADKRDQMIELGKKSGFDTLKNVIDMMPEQAKPGDQVNLTNNGGQNKVGNFEDLLKLGRKAVEKFRDENRDEYVKLFKAHYGVEPQIEE